MMCKKWWLWTAAAIVAAAVIYVAFFYAGNKEQSPGATLVRIEEGAGEWRMFPIFRQTKI